MNNPPPLSQEAESQWDEKEMTELATELFRQREQRLRSPNSNQFPAAQLLFDNLNIDHTFTPNWEHLRLPKGRTVASCKGICEFFQRRRLGSIPSNLPQVAAPSPMSFAAPMIPSKRKPSQPAEGGPASYGARNIAPRPTTTDPNRSQGGTHPHSPLIELQQTAGEHPVRKKRGRPRKAEVEERKAQALERQNIERLAAAQVPQQSYASPLMATTQSPFAAFAPQTAHLGPREAPTETSAPQSPQFADVTATPRNTQQPEGDVGSSSSNSRKKRGRPPKVDTEGIPPPTFSTSASSAGAYGSPPQSGVSVGSIPGRRLSVSTRSQGGPFQQEQGGQDLSSEEMRQQQNRQRSWNDTVMGNSSNPNLRQPPPP